VTRPNRGERYSRVAILFHWVIAVLVVVNLIVGLGHESIPAMRAWMPGHKAIGVTVLALTLARVAWRLSHRPPALPASVPAGERRLALAAHWALYALLLGMPLSGWVMVSSPEGRRPLTWFGTFDIPFLPVGAGASDTAATAHGVLGWTMLALVVLHVLAALRHHLILRDATLVRIAPWLARG
jgi:cytochrome b561